MYHILINKKVTLRMHAPIHNAAIHNALTIQSTNTQFVFSSIRFGRMMIPQDID